MVEMAAAALDVDFYESATDGPTLRVAGTSGGMRILRDACEVLVGGEESVRLSDLAGVRLSERVKSVEFRFSAEDGHCHNAEDPAAFVFTGDRSQWAERVLLLNALVEPGTPGTFQLLEPNDTGGVCIEAAVIR
jgi:hypothetical protein